MTDRCHSARFVLGFLETQSYPMQRGCRVPIREAKHTVGFRGRLTFFLLNEDEIRPIKEALESKFLSKRLPPSPPDSVQLLFQLRMLL